MIYTQQMFGLELKSKLALGYNYNQISDWAFQLYHDPELNLDTNLTMDVFKLVAMQEGPEFLLSEEELQSIASDNIAVKLHHNAQPFIFVTTSKIDQQKGLLVYRKNEYSFDTLDCCGEGITSILINDLQVEIGLDGTLLYVWGLCPILNYTETTLTPKDVLIGGIKLNYSEEICAGISIRLNKNNRWPLHFNKEHGWICIGDPKVDHVQMIQFSPGCVASIDNQSLIAIWLQPIFLDS